MEHIRPRNSEGEEPVPKSFKFSQKHEAHLKLLEGIQALEQAKTTLFERIDKAKKSPVDLSDELQRDVELFQDRANKVLNAARSEDNEGEVSENCLGLPTILRRILEQLSSKELINLSLVNKLWNFEARSVLRDRGCLRVRINSKDTAPKLIAFANDLHRMRVVPISGIHVEIDHFGDERDSCHLIPSRLLDQYYQDILNRLTWKHLSVEFSGNWWDCEDCPALVLIKRILEGYCGVLEELSICLHGLQFVELFHNVFQHWSFPNLKTLELNGAFAASPAANDLVKTLVYSAPNLEILYMDDRIMYQENIMEGSSAVLWASDGLWPLSHQVCDSLIDALRSEAINVFCERFHVFDKELLNRFVPMVIQSSHTTLKSLWMDFLFAVPLMCYGILLENVTDLRIHIADNTVEGLPPDILTLVKGFDFTRIFPKLDKIQIEDWDYRAFSLDDISTFVERGKAVGRKALPDRAVNIRHLELYYPADPSLIFLAQMFPHVKKILITTRVLQTFPFTLLWEHFGCLAELNVVFEEYSTSGKTNLDNVFCGMFQEEVEDLRAKDDEYLKAVNIVPVMPSITCMKGLKLLKLDYATSSLDEREDPIRIFYRVTGLLGFMRCPTLSVTLQAPSRLPQALDHMRPYVSFMTEEPPLRYPLIEWSF